MAQITMADLKPCDKWNILDLPFSAQWKNSKNNYLATVLISPLKFIYSEKATKFCKISALLLTGTT